MSTWNYRIVLHEENPDPEKHWYGLHECYYEPTGWTETPVTFVCDKDEGPETIIRALEMALHTLRKSTVIQPGDPTTWAP